MLIYLTSEKQCKNFMWVQPTFSIFIKKHLKCLINKCLLKVNKGWTITLTMWRIYHRENDISKTTYLVSSVHRCLLVTLDLNRFVSLNASNISETKNNKM